MIQKVGQRIEFNAKKGVNQTINVNNENKTKLVQNPISSTSVDSKLLEKYYVNFGATMAKKAEPSKLKKLETHYTDETEQLVKSASAIAKKYGHKEVTDLHIFQASLISLNQYINDLDTGAKTYSQESNYEIPVPLERHVSNKLFSDEKNRKLIKPLIEEEIKNTDKLLSKMPKAANNEKNPKLSKSLVNNAYAYYVEEQSGETPTNFPDGMFLSAILYADTEKTDSVYHSFLFKLQEKIMLNENKPEKRVHLKMYDDRARKILKNLSHGTNTFITYEPRSNTQFLINSIVNVFEKETDESSKLNPKNTNMLIFNDNVNEEYFLSKVKRLAKDKDENYVLIINLNKIFANESCMEEGLEEAPVSISDFDHKFVDLMKNPPKNLQFIFTQDKNSYYSNVQKPIHQKLFHNFVDIPLPILGTEEAKKAFRDQPLLMEKIEVPFTRNAIDKAIELASKLDGQYPEKAQRLMQQIAHYYIDKKEVNEKDIFKYVNETKGLFKKDNDKSSVEVVFDTGKKLKDIIGKESTKKEAAGIVKQIKERKLGTKGAIIYSEDGTPGAGRKHTAKAIAGETKSPYIEINAMDFGTKEVDLFGESTTSPEASIKKLFSLVNSQAEESPNKSAVLFIENFEYFSVGELVSEYHQKAMSQLLREMEKSSEKGLNILIVGSVNNPQYIGESTMKSFKFVDSIEISSPAGNVNAREEILTHFMKDRKVKIAGTTEAEKKDVIRLVAETAEGFPFIYLINIIDKAKTVANERGHKEIDKSDFTEAYLQITTGRPANGPISKHRKEIVTSHECGHATNEEVMWNIAKTQTVPWHLPDKVNFITLDPRGVFGGAMYSKFGGNEEWSFERVFADLVCDYGGHSCEKHFYNINGSWGITGDLQMATNSANQSVQYMGQGPTTGKISVAGLSRTQQLPDELKNRIFKDVDVFLNNSNVVSDAITRVYADFNREFTEKYSHLVGTGDCLVQGDVFRQELETWKAKQSTEKQQELARLDQDILKTIECTKKGIKVSLGKF